MVESILSQYTTIHLFMWAVFVIAGIIILDNVINKK
jgi:hypothetical protein